MNPTAERLFVDHCCELLASVGPCTARRMFGGWGIATGGLNIGLIVRDTLYLKANDQTRAPWLAAGCAPFTYQARGATRQLDQGLFTLFVRVRTRSKQRQSRRTTTPRLAAWARSATMTGAVFTAFPSGCSQKGHAPRCEALPGSDPGCVSRLAHGLFDLQRISYK